MDQLHIVGTSETYVKKYRLYGMKTTFRFKPVPSNTNEIEWLKEGFSKLVEKMKSQCSDTDYLGFTLKSLNLKNKEPGYVAFRPASEVDSDILWEIFGGIIQSNAESIKSTHTFTVECTRVNLPVGSGKVRKNLYNSFSEECRSRHGIVGIQNEDNLCLPRAIVVAKAYAKKRDKKVLRSIREDFRGIQTDKVNKLIAKARVEIPAEGAGIPELEKLQDHLKKYKITVYNYGTKGRDVFFSGENPNATHKLNLLFHEGHYNVITSLTGAFSCTYYCEACHTPYDHKANHRCASTCSSCLTISPPCVVVDNGITCPNCNRHFKNQTCLAAHQGDVCNWIKKCTDCGKFVFAKTRKSKHVCGEVFCSTCTDFKDPNHQCYMQVNRAKPKTKDYLYIFFDFETRQDETLHDSADTRVHKVNLCVSKQYCWECISSDECDSCLLRTKIFKEEPVTHFMNYVMEVKKKYKTVSVIAHNGSGFDFNFILKHIIDATSHTPKTIMRGTKILLLEVDNVRFVDSLSYFPMALSALPKAFDLPPESKKGYFPHLFNTLANQSYVGPVPAKEFYCPDSMFEDSYKTFCKWHDDQVRNNYVFDFQKEIVEYCISDVEILAQACIKFRNLFLRECNVDPFMESITIASACNLAFRRNFLKPNTIGLIPKNGYRMTQVQSAIALQWLCWEEEQRNVTIQHAGRGREIKISGSKVDGFDGERIYEFHGCYWHGCPKCFPYKREEPLKEDPSDTLHNRFEATKAKIEKLSQSDYEIIEMWECQFKSLKKERKLNHLKSLPMLNALPLKPREAFFGGRTGNAKTYHKCTDMNETIKYVDVCSLYPYICKYGKYPIGHPIIHVGNRDCNTLDINSVDGLLKCKILPPLDLYHPVLPSKMNGKLMFVLCRLCGENQNQSDCDHSSEERAIVGTWTMDEIRMALSKGYTILDMFEMWEYKVAKFETGGLFTDFINKFLKMKQEASGFPSWCSNDEDKDRYIKEYFDHEGVKLDKEKIEKNAGLRSLAKLMLNSFWGKLGQKEHTSKTLITRDPEEFFKIMTSPEIQVNAVNEINEDVLVVNWEYLEEADESLRTVNVVLAAYTTAQARLQLYKYLNDLGPQVLYYDTDSCIYYHKEGLHKVPTGDYLGEMTDELSDEYGPGSFISEFVSGGPKTYAYKVVATKQNKTKTVCKVKGLTLNQKSCKIVNFEKLKEMVLSETQTPVCLDENRIRRTKDKNIVTVHESKLFKITGPKRRREGVWDTLPFGYKKRKM